VAERSDADDLPPEWRDTERDPPCPGDERARATEIDGVVTLRLDSTQPVPGDRPAARAARSWLSAPLESWEWAEPDGPAARERE